MITALLGEEKGAGDMLQPCAGQNGSAPPIPAEDLARQYRFIEGELRRVLDRVLSSGRYTLGPELASFEQEFAAVCGTHYAIGVSNGTDALHLALAACDIGPGDEVITIPNTYIATALAITYVGAMPVFVDVEPHTYNLNPDLLPAAITEHTKAIIPVHMYGQPSNMNAILALARRYGLRVIEDASHAHGAYYHGVPVGSLGDIGCFSFHPSKVLGALGDAGAVVTNDLQLDARLRQLRYVGQKVKHQHEIIGFQKRMDEIQAAILRVKLRFLPGWIASRQAIAARYNELLSGIPIVTPYLAADRTHSFYAYTALVPRRDELRDYLTERGVGTQVLYPTLIPDQPAYHSQRIRCDPIPVARAMQDQLLCLPIFPELRNDEIEHVAAAIIDFYSA